MKYLFLDDERWPNQVTWIVIGNVGAQGIPWTKARSFYEATELVRECGFPEVISFDHDLGVEWSNKENKYVVSKTGMDFAKWLVEYDMETNLMPDNFTFTVHSKNEQGKINIESLLNNYIKFKKKQK